MRRDQRRPQIPFPVPFTKGIMPRVFTRRNNVVVLSSAALVFTCFVILTVTHLPSPDVIQIRTGSHKKQPIVHIKEYPADKIKGESLDPWLNNHKRLIEKNLLLPKCPSGVRLNGDDTAVEKLTNCVKDKTSMMFPVSMESWRYTKTAVCGNDFVVFHKEAALLRNVLVDVEHLEGECTEDDFFTSENERRPKKGFFTLEASESCSKMTTPNFSGGSESHLAQWSEAVRVEKLSISNAGTSDHFAIAVRRYEHHNIYHTMSDIYNAFLAARFFGISPHSVEIVFIDGKSSLSSKMLSPWKTLFHSVHFICHMDKPTLFPALLFNKRGIDSDLLEFTGAELPLSEDFSDYLLSSYKLKPKELDCQRPLTALLVSRGDYMNRNISRQVTNEKEIHEAVNSDKSIGVSVQWVRLESMDLVDQFRLAANTDILGGMHGAGLTLSLFIPPHAGLVEFKPKYFKNAHRHFQGIARWRNLSYDRWENTDPSLEKGNTHSVIPVAVVKEMLFNMRRSICGN